jgi:virulence-associated protein VagC
MILKIATDGVLIPRDYFPGAEEVELRREGDRVVVVPVARPEASPAAPSHNRATSPDPDDSIWGLGRNPVALGRPDASNGEGIEPPKTGKIGSIYDHLGKNPIECGPPDASERLDEYIYGNPHGDEPR